MVILRSVALAVRLAWPSVLRPWRSPLLRWRMETFGIRGRDGRLLTAAQIGPAEFWRFTRTNRAALARFLRWSATLPSGS